MISEEFHRQMLENKGVNESLEEKRRKNNGGEGVLKQNQLALNQTVKKALFSLITD